MLNKIDHFAGVRGGTVYTAEQTKEEDRDTPAFSLAQAEYLEKVFCFPAPKAALDDRAEVIAATVHYRNGKELVVAHIRALAERTPS